jgi:uncharacterized membrane protein YphA (DoxX/SURF4 family)
MWTLLEWVARILFVAFFIMSGVSHLVNRQGLTAYAQSKKLPAAGPAVVVSGLMMLAGAVMILVDWHPDWGAWLLVLFLVPAAFTMHNYWTETDPGARANQQAHFWKNITIAAAAILYAASVRGMPT